MAKKKVNFKLIPPMDGDHEPEPYTLLTEAREKWHDDIRLAKIALAWKLREKSDTDGHLLLGKCIKVSDLYKEFSAFDFIILLNRGVWDDIGFTREKKLALLDHELCHADVSCDMDSGETKIDERGRIVYRMRKHDIEEFQSVVRHHGCYKHDLERFAEVLLAKQRTPLLHDDVTVSMGVTDENGEMKYTEPVSHEKFMDACDKIAGKVN
jgi:Putative phage metallopeptidase